MKDRRLSPLLVASLIFSSLLGVTSGVVARDGGTPPRQIAQRTHPRLPAARISFTPDDPRTLEPPGASLVPHLVGQKLPLPDEVDRAHALTLFAEGRLLFQREEYQQALKRYQRAYQWNPSAQVILDEIVPLAFHLKDGLTGTRYAVLAAEQNPGASDLVEPVIEHLGTEREFARALRLKQKSLAVGEHDKRSSVWVQHQHDIGRLALLAGRFQEAGDAFAVVDDALQRPNDFQLDADTRESLARNEEILLTLMAESFLRSERLDRAERLFQRIQEIAPNDNAFRLRQAELAHRRKDDQRALKELQQYLDAQATDGGVDAYHLLRDVLQSMGQLDDKSTGYVARLEQAGLAGPPNPMMTYALAEFHQAQNRLDQALPLYQVSLDGSPTVEAFRGAFACCNALSDTAAFWELLGTFVDSGGDWDEIDDPDSPLASNAQLMAYLFERADKQLAERPSGSGRVTPSHFFGAGRMAVHTGDISRATKYYTAAIDRGLDAHPEWVISAGLEFYLADQYPPAITWLRRAYESAEAEQKSEVISYLAMALEFDGQTDEALRYLATAIGSSPVPLLLKSRQAWVNYHAKRFEVAESQCRALIREFDTVVDDPLVRETLKEIRSILSNIRLEANDMSQAAEWLQQVLDEFPEDEGAMNDLGYLWADANQNLHRALRMVQFAVERRPENFAYLDSLGWTLYRLGRFAEAIEALEKSVRLSADEDDGVVLEHLGDAYHKSARQEDALRTWRAAREAFRKTDNASKLQEMDSKIEAHSK